MSALPEKGEAKMANEAVKRTLRKAKAFRREERPWCPICRRLGELSVEEIDKAVEGAQ